MLCSAQETLRGAGPPQLSCSTVQQGTARAADPPYSAVPRETQNQPQVWISQKMRASASARGPSREEQRRGLGKGCPGDEPVSQIWDIEARMH